MMCFVNGSKPPSTGSSLTRFDRLTTHPTIRTRGGGRSAADHDLMTTPPPKHHYSGVSVYRTSTRQREPGALASLASAVTRGASSNSASAM